MKAQRNPPLLTEGVDDADTEKDPDVKAKQSNKERESGRAGGKGLDNENAQSFVVHEDGQGAPDKRAADKDSDPTLTSPGKDNVESKRAAQDKVREKVNCQSGAALGQSMSQGNKATCDETGKDGTQSESTNGLELSCAGGQ